MSKYIVSILLMTASCSDPVPGHGSGSNRNTPSECSDDGDCPSGLCRLGRCEPEPSPADAGFEGCVVDADCPDDARCVDGQCEELERCVRGADCPDGSRCQAGRCTDEEVPEYALSADPASVVVGFQAASEEARAQLALVNSGQNALTIEEITLEGSFAFAFENFPEIPQRLVPNQQVQLNIVYTADDLVPDEAVIWVRTDQQSLERLSVPVTSYTKNPEVPQADPCLSVGPTSLNFGQVARGQFADQRFALENCGSEPVTVSAINRGRTFFVPLPSSVTLEPAPAMPLTLQVGERQEVTVRYTARQATRVSGHWEVLSDDAASPRQRVNVRASTPPPPIEEQGLHIRMSWDTDLNDVDMHLLAPGGQFFDCPLDVYFSNKSPDWGQPGDLRDDPFLDLDDVDGFGPENLNIEAPVPGVYTLIAHYYDRHGQLQTPQTTFEISSFGQRIGQYGPTGLPSVGQTWDVVEIEWIGGGQPPVLRPMGAIGRRAHGNNCR